MISLPTESEQGDIRVGDDWELGSDGCVVVAGEKALDAKGKPIVKRGLGSFMCQRCKRTSVQVPLVLMVRYENALNRRMYWHGIDLGWEALGALRCGGCCEREQQAC